MKKIITRHQSLVSYLQEIGLSDGTEEVLSHASADDVRGQDVIGVLPLSLASVAKSVTEVPLALTPADRGQELSLERLREIAGDPVTYRVFSEGSFRSATEEVAISSGLQATYQTDPMTGDGVRSHFEGGDR